MQDNMVDSLRKGQISFVLDDIIAILYKIAANDLHTMLYFLLLN